MEQVITDCLIESQVTASLPNWPQAKALYLRGMDQSSICSKCNVSLVALRKRVLREGWVKQRQEQTQTVSFTVSDVPKANRETESNSEKTRSILGELIVKYALALKALAVPRSMKQIREHIATLASISDASAPLFGWNTSGSMTLNIDLLSTSREVKEPQPAIDIQSTQVPANPPVES